MRKHVLLVAAFAVMAFGGFASAASADQLRYSDGTAVAHGTALRGIAGSSTLTTSNGTITCTASQVNGSVTEGTSVLGRGDRGRPDRGKPWATIPKATSRTSRSPVAPQRRRQHKTTFSFVPRKLNIDDHDLVNGGSPADKRNREILIG